MKKNYLSLSGFSQVLVLSVFLLSFLLIPVSTKTASASTNLINDPSFNAAINNNWSLWVNEDSSREYLLSRSYQTPFGHEPYSMSVSSNDTSASSNFDATLSSIDKSQFTLKSGEQYQLSFYVKASSQFTFLVFMQDSQSYATVSEVVEISADENWEKVNVVFTASSSSLSHLHFALGQLPANSTIYFDGFNLFNNDVSLKTTQVSGDIGDKNKTLSLSQSMPFSADNIQVELPYFDNLSGEITRKKFTAKSLDRGRNVRFDMEEQTFSGLGKLYIMDNLIGEFDYNVSLELDDYGPKPLKSDEDLVVYGTGFHPELDKNYLIVSVINSEGKVSEEWLTPSLIDSNLSQAVFKLPVGVTSGRLSARSYYINNNGENIESRSRNLNYTIKPLIYELKWSVPNQEQVGDSITIFGKGISNRPQVIFYDLEGNLITRSRATFKEINLTEGYEAIEVTTPRNLNNLQVTVKLSKLESDMVSALTYSAKPILSSIKSTNSRRTAIGNTVIAASKTGDSIRLNGMGFTGATYASIEFKGLNEDIVVSVGSENIDPKGRWINVVVSKGAQSGQIRVDVNGRKSNFLALEIIPTIISVNPITPTPGQEMSFWVNGAGLDKEKLTIHFKYDKNNVLDLKAESLTESEFGDIIVKLIAPRSIPNNSSNITISYGPWTSDTSHEVVASPQIDRAGMNMDTKILTINGSGFSTSAKLNNITFKYADGTIVDTRIKYLDVKNTNEGQELSVQILDDYYYGYISVEVDGQISNEYNVGPVLISRMERRVQYVAAEGKVMGVLYITGNNFGDTGDVKVGDVWANTHYRTKTFIIAVVETKDLYKNPVIITKAQ